MSRKRRNKQSGKHQEDMRAEILQEETETAEETWEDASEEEYEEDDMYEEDDADDRDDTDDMEEIDDTYDEVDDTYVEDVGDDIDDEEEEEEEMPLKKKRRRHRRGRRRKKERKPLGKKFWIILGSVIGGIAVLYLGVAAYFIGHFFVNTSINGKDFSGKSAAAVEEYLKGLVDEYELKLVEMNNESDVIKGSEISLSYDERTGVKDALKKQNPLLWPQGFFTRTSRDVQVEVSYDEQALEEKLSTIKAVTQEQTEPVSAYPKFDGESFVVEPEVYGTAVNMDQLTKKIKEYLSAFKPELNMLDEGCYKLPKYTKDSEEVQAACDAMNEYGKASITYTMDEDVVVDKTVIAEWLKYDENMNVSLDEKAVRSWMKEFGKKYDTVGKTRTITTPTGKSAEVSGGTYGWSIDEEKETKTLIDLVKKGETTSREPAYEQEAASHSAQDWGDTYIDVDLSAQHMWYISGGSVAFEADVVTGTPTPDRITPTGVYSILEKMRNKTLVGEKDPDTGKPIYETPVDYWMRVTWTGIGFHDATWQSSFGGNRYQNGYGSHGCINMSLGEASQLYDMISVGLPVIIHN